MEKISIFLNSDLKTIKNKSKNLKLEPIDILSVQLTALNKLQFIVNYFNKFPLLGIKYLDFKDWVSVFNLISSKQHLTESGRLEIKKLKSNMNNSRSFIKG